MNRNAMLIVAGAVALGFVIGYLASENNRLAIENGNLQCRVTALETERRNRRLCWNRIVESLAKWSVIFTQAFWHHLFDK
ncbi:MAG: hypothetical protein ACLPT4_05935 [Verrucomicrobiia bacterium]